MKVVALFRVSTEKQANEGASLDSQEREYRELAARHGWATVREFRGCESATQAASERRVLQQVLACIAEQEVDAVYVHEQSRLTRGDELEAALLMRELKERNIKILVHGVLRDPASIDDRFMLGIQSLVDRAESDRIKERLQRGKKQRALQGRKNCGAAAYGYVNPPPGDPKRGTLRVVEAEAAVVRRIYDMALHGAMGVCAIVKELNRLGIPASRGGKWVKNAVARILENPVYRGASATNIWLRVGKTRGFRLDLDNPKATIVENAHEAIVPPEVWYAVRQRPKRATSRRPRMLSGLVYVNGRPATGDTSCRQSYYRGPRGQRGNPWLATDTVDGAVWDAFVSLATGKEFVESLLRANQNSKARDLAAHEAEFLRDQIAKRERRLERLLEMRADGEITKEQYRDRAGKDQADLDGLRRDLAAQERLAAAGDPSHAQWIVKAVQTLLAGRTRLTTAQKRSVLGTVLGRVDVEAGPTGALPARGPGGRLKPGAVPQWQINKITLRVNASAAAARPAPDDVCGQEPVTVGEGSVKYPDGQLATTWSCSVRRAPARR